MTPTSKVISAFPGTGKTYAASKIGEDACDSDSSLFSWSAPGVRNPDFPANYIAHVRQEMGRRRYVFVSSHQIVRDALRDAGIEVVTFYPRMECKPEYMRRYHQRRSPEDFIHLIDRMWEPWIGAMEAEENAVSMGPMEYLSDVLKEGETL